MIAGSIVRLVMRNKKTRTVMTEFMPIYNEVINALKSSGYEVTEYGFFLLAG